MFRPKSGHGATGQSSVAGQHLLFPPWIDPEPFDLKPRHQIRTYPFGVTFSKESLKDVVLNPQPKAHFKNTPFSFENVNQFGLIQIRFLVFTKLPLSLFWL